MAIVAVVAAQRFYLLNRRRILNRMGSGAGLLVSCGAELPNCRTAELPNCRTAELPNCSTS